MKILIVVPHFSGGGMPQFVLLKTKLLLEKHEVAIFEWNDYGKFFPVQRNEIMSLLGDNFHSGYGGDENKTFQLGDLLNSFNPDVVHFEELPETFCDNPFIENLFNSKKYITMCSTHGSHKHSIKYIPDLFVWPSEYCIQMYPQYPNFKVWEYPIFNHVKERAEKINNTITNVSQVGLWSAHKNQGYTLQLAESLKMLNFRFLFAGNMADNFKDYWGGLVPIANSMKNVIVKGECNRDEINLIYRHTDILIMPSTIELNPISVKEALSYGCKVLISDLPNLPSWYRTCEYIGFLTGNAKKDSDLLIEMSEKKFNEFNIPSISYDINTVYEGAVKSENPKLPPQIRKPVSFSVTYHDTPSLTIKNGSGLYEVRFVDAENDKVLFYHKIRNQGSCTTFYNYFIQWRVEVWQNGEIVWKDELNLNGKDVFVTIGSSSLGDTIAWVPVADQFQRKTNCRLILSTFYNNLFDRDFYSNIKFVKPEDVQYNYYAHYKVGVYNPDNRYAHPNHPHIIPLQKIAADRLGVPFKTSIKPKLNFIKQPIENHVVMCLRSTAGAKEWQAENGWKDLITKLVSEDYSVDAIQKRPNADLQKEKESLERILSDLNISEHEYTPISHLARFIFDKTLEEVIGYISEASCFIGLPSGLSWVAWALDVPVVMISGFSYQYAEFDSYRVGPESECRGCWNDPDVKFDRGDWYWCPRHKGTNRQFECTKSITSSAVYEKVKQIIP